MKSKKCFQLNKKTKNDEKEEEWRRHKGGEMDRRKEIVMDKERCEDLDEKRILKEIGKREKAMEEGIIEDTKIKIEKKEGVGQTNFLIRKDKRVLFVERIGVRQNDLDKSIKHDDNSKKVMIIIDGGKEEGERNMK